MASISNRYKAIFFHLPKTGGMSIREFLKPYGFISIKNNCHTIWSTQELIQNGICSRFKELISNDDMYDNYFKFCFIRNPWDRYVSAWKSLINKGHIHDSFTNFVLNPIRTADSQEEQDVIWHSRISQVRQITDDTGAIMVNFIGRFERINEDFKKVCDRLDIPFQRLSHVNITEHKHYSKYYTEETKEIIAVLFKDDVERFGYTFERL